MATYSQLRAQCHEDGDCLLWDGCLTSEGTPLVNEGGQGRRARRVMFALVKGPVPAGKNVIATCWHPLCVAPKHLRAVTKKEQMQQAAAHGRLFVPGRTAKQMACKRASKQAKLDIDKVREIRRRRQEGEPLTKIAEAFGVHHSLVHRIALNRAWREPTVANASIFNSTGLQIRLEPPSQESVCKAVPPQQFGRRDPLNAHCVLSDPMASPAMVEWARAVLSQAASAALTPKEPPWSR